MVLVRGGGEKEEESKKERGGAKGGEDKERKRKKKRKTRRVEGKTLGSGRWWGERENEGRVGAEKEKTNPKLLVKW